MPTLREKIAGLLLRQLSSNNDNSKAENGNIVNKETSPHTPEDFIHKYLNGQSKRNQPEIIFSKCCYDLPMKKVAKLSKVVLATHTGPSGGLTLINRKPKPFEYLDVDVDFIDEDYDENGIENGNHDEEEDVNGVENDLEKIDGEKKPTIIDDYPEIIAGIRNWQLPDDRAYGVARSLYEKNPLTKSNAGEPVADAFAICLRENSSVLVLADGVNWGEKSCLAARCAVHGCMDYLNNALYREGGRIETTMDIFVCLLRSFYAAHTLILQEEGNLTTLCAAVVCQLRNSANFVVCTCNVGDSLAYVYSQKHGVREITQGSHDINSMRDMRDALGALGPVDGLFPELNNLTVSMTVAEPGDYVFLCSDGIIDNLDPVVGKFATARKPEKPERKSLSGNVAPVSDAETGPAGKSVKRQNSNGQDNSLKRHSKKLNLRRQTSTANDANNKKSADTENRPPSLPILEAYQRHQLTLLRMEDLLEPRLHHADTARGLCDELVRFAMDLTIAKRKILEDPQLYNEGDPDTQLEQRSRRRKVAEKLCTAPGKLDHASATACRVGNYKPRSPVRRERARSKSPSTKRSSHHHHHSHHHRKSSDKDNANNNNNGKVSRGMKTDNELSRFESSI